MNPSIIRCEDGSILIEWILANNGRSRFGISVEPLLEETSWYFIAEDGTLQGAVVPSLLAGVLNFLQNIPQEVQI